MDPLSRKTRNSYLFIFILLFVVLVPITILYSGGYRLGEGFAIVKTGGVYVGLQTSGAQLYLNGKLVKRAGILKNGFFIQDLTPRVYHVVVEKDGYHRWEKILEVAPQHVVETSAFIIPKEIVLVEIPEFIQGRGLAGAILNPEYTELATLFATSTTETTLAREDFPEALATSSRVAQIESAKKKGDIVLWEEDGFIYTRWINNNRNAPSYFCESGICNKEIQVNRKPVSFFDFFIDSNELLVFKVPEGILMTEIDPRIPRNERIIYASPQAEFRIVDNSVMVRDGAQFFSIEL